MKYVELTRNKKAMVDNRDYLSLSKFKWHYNSDGYARRSVRNKTTGKTDVFLMHRQILKTPLGMETDHINGNRLDNRRSNLRVCTRAENLRNRKLNFSSTSGIKGVCWSQKAQKWQAGIKINKKSYYLGQFNKIEDAAKAYAIAAHKLFGEYARIK